MPPKKNSDGNPTRNAVTLFSILLFSGRAYSLKRLAEILDCSRQTVLRLIDQIEMSGRANIRKWTQDGQSFYQIETPQSRPQTTLSPKEVEQLVLCREWLRHLLPQGIRQGLELATEKSAVLLENYETRPEALTPLGHSAVKGRIDYAGFENILETLTTAIRKHQVVEAVYTSPHREEPKTHLIVPARLVAFHEALYVRGWIVTPRGVPEVTSVITLAVHRLQSVTPTRRSLAEDAVNELPSVDENGYFGMAQQRPPFEVKARFFGGGARYVRERQWSTDCTMEDERDGSLVMTFTAQSELEVVKWILGFGVEAELLAPPFLREKVRDELRGALAFYD